MGLPPCNPGIFKNGHSIAALDAGPRAAEKWVRSVARRAEAPVDWHYSGGIVNVLYFGDKKVRERVQKAIIELTGSLDGRVLRRFGPTEQGLYRKGITEVPEGAVVAFYEPGRSGSTFMVG